ncbi:MAG: ABC transporter permease, partial [Gemmatimonadetes bacterium]|nr:ABC transporter permease [Gemmatimonadota bacterium]
TSRTGTTLTVADWEAIAREVPGVLRTAPVAERPLLARVGGRTVSVRVHGTTAEFAQARNFQLAAGRFIDGDDLLNTRRVAVVGALVVEELYHGESPLGELLLLSGIPFRIIGVTKKKGVVDGANEDELVIIPLPTALRRLLSVESLNRIWVQTVSEDATAATRSEIATLIRRRHAIPTDRPDDFGIQDQTAMVRSRQQAGDSLSRLVTGLSALALGLGGVGLLAVSLLSVRERYADIGLRLAVGGLPRDILLQFLTEAVLTSALGGAVGLAAGAGGIIIGTFLTSWPMVLSWQAVVYPLLISVAIAVVFGAYPALRAARLDPILALNSK